MLQQLRKDSGLDISDRIDVTWQAEGELAVAMEAHAAAIADEVLATSFTRGDVGELATEFHLDGTRGAVSLSRA